MYSSIHSPEITRVPLKVLIAKRAGLIGSMASLWIGLLSVPGYTGNDMTASCLQLSAGAHYTVPLGHSGRKWLPFSGPAGTLLLRTTLPNLYLYTHANAGMLESRGDDNLRLLGLQFEAGPLYYFDIHGPLKIGTGLYLHNLQVYFSDRFQINHHGVFTTSENEFGPVVECRLRLTGRHLFASLPIAGGTVFSEPHGFTFFRAGLSAGVVW